MIDLDVKDYRGCEKLATIYLIRHGATKGNLEKRYIGCKTDEPLCEEGMRQVLKLKRSGLLPEKDNVDILLTSPMLRCRQTLGVLYPDAQKNVVDEFTETDFGEFENKNYEDLKDDPYYQKWIESNGELPFPNGESRQETKTRMYNAFSYLTVMIESAYEVIVNTASREPVIVAAVHGGTIMSLLSQYGYGSYYDYQCGNADGYIAEFLEDEEGLPLLADIRPLGSDSERIQVQL